MKISDMPHLRLQIHQQVDDLRLDRDVEGGDRLVAYDHARAVDHGARDADALALATREFVRIAVDLVRQQTDLGHHLTHALLHLRARQVRVEGGQRLGNDLPDRHARIERGERILEDDLHVAPLLLHVAMVQRMAGLRPATPRARRSRGAGAGQRGPKSTCRSRIRRPGPGFRPAAGRR
jgi:hypothetical protein